MSGMTATDPTAVNWAGELRGLTDDHLHDRVHALALWIANDVAAGRAHEHGVVDKYRAAADERDRRVLA